MTPEQIKQAIKLEYQKCAQNPAYFMKKYCKIQHPKKGRILFNLYPFQAKVLNLWKNHEKSIILKSRQLGISTLAAGYSLWLMIFHEDKNILCIATKQETARNMVTKVKFMFNNLPVWLKEEDLEKNKLSLRLSNGSQIKAASSASDSARSEAVSLLIIDEAAFIDNVEETWASAQQTLATGGGAIVLSTPNGVGNWFHREWEKAVSGDNSFLPIELKWTVHPERDESWRLKQDKELGIRMAAQECDCSFTDSGNTFIEPALLNEIKLGTQDPIYKAEIAGTSGTKWYWKTPSLDGRYMTIVDTARGDGDDSSSIQVIDLDTVEQVMEWKGDITPKELGRLSVSVAAEWNNAILVIENTGIGYSTAETAEESGYNFLYYTPKNGKHETYGPNMYIPDGSRTLGFTNSLKTRPLVLSKLEEYLKSRILKINSKRTEAELRTFVWKAGKPQASNGYHDDLVLPLAIGVYLRDAALSMRGPSVEKAQAALNGITTVNSNLIIPGSTLSRRGLYPGLDKGLDGEDYSWVLG